MPIASRTCAKQDLPNTVMDQKQISGQSSGTDPPIGCFSGLPNRWGYIVNYPSFSPNSALCDFGILRGNQRPRRNHHSGFCRTLAIAVIVFQLRVVARDPKILSSWPR